MVNTAPSIRTVPVRVLVIDGHQIVLFSVLHMLSGSGYRVREAGTARHGLELAQEHPDIILVDISLPDGNGIDFCRQIKSSPETSSIPVILLSHVNDAEKEWRNAADAGADALIEFPLTPEKLVMQIARALENRNAEERASL